MDLVLTLVLVVFFLEWAALSVVDVGSCGRYPYLLGFYWYMDLIGTVSMVFDISYLLGTP